MLSLEALVYWTLVIGASSAAATTILRKMSPVERRVLEGKRPWACDLCMAFWTTSIAWLVLTLLGMSRDLYFAFGPALVTSLLVLRKLSDPVRLPIPLPPLRDSG